MITPERNDVNISKLFHWGKKFTIRDKYDNALTDVYIRLVGDADIHKARVYAMRRSAGLRKILKDPESDEYFAFIDSIYSMEDQNELVELIVLLKTRDFGIEVEKDLYLPFPKEPKSDATLEEQEKYQEQVDSYPQRRLDLLTKEITKKALAYREELLSKDLPALQKTYIKLFTDQLCESEMIKAFRDYCVFCGTFTDEKFTVPFFNNVDEFLNLPTEIKEQYISDYSELEISVEELKKSLEVTQS